MKKILYLIGLLFLVSCARKPVLDSKDYKIIDILNIEYNAFNKVLGYDVLIKVDSTYFFGCMDKSGNLTYLGKKVNLDK